MTVTTARRQLVPVLRTLTGDPLKVVEDGEADVLIYLVDQLGGNLGYSWEWERFGPFSEELAADLADLKADDFGPSGVPARQAMETIDRVKRVIDEPIAGLDMYKTVRLLASVHFARTHMRESRPTFLKLYFPQGAIDKAIYRLEQAEPAAG